MTLVVPDTSEVLMLKYLLNVLTTSGAGPSSSGNRVLKLYNNDVTPVEATTTVTECTETGYAAITLTQTWTVATSVGVTTGVYSEMTFNFTTGVTAYGYYVTSQAGELLWLERFSGGPFTLPSGGGQIAVTPTITLE